MSYIESTPDITIPIYVIRETMGNRAMCVVYCLSEEKCNGFGVHTDGRCLLYKAQRPWTDPIPWLASVADVGWRLFIELDDPTNHANDRYKQC